ncbi:unnamed protein product [Effrenium voratum]|nr:unnamed protein product [Effrenium voratum]
MGIASARRFDSITSGALAPLAGASVSQRYGSIFVPCEDGCEEAPGANQKRDGGTFVSAWFGDPKNPGLRQDVTQEVQQMLTCQRRVEVPALARHIYSPGDPVESKPLLMKDSAQGEFVDAKHWGDPATFRLKQLEAVTYEQVWLSSERPVFQQRAAPPPGDIILMPVLHLRFTHDKIRPVFRKGRHRGQPIYELVNDLVKGVVNPLVNLPPLEIYLHKGVWRSLNNRRLWALKAYMGLSGNFQLLVRVCISSRSAAAFREKNSTHTDGLSVEVTGDETALKEAFYNQPSQLCHYWRHGECFRGDSCPFEHEDPSERKAIEDKYHLTAARRLLAKIYQKCCGPPSTQGSLEEQTRDFERCLIDNLTSITDTPLSPQESISLDCKVQECPAGPFSPGFDPLGLSSGESHASSGGLVKPWKSPLNLQEVELQLKAELGLAPDLKAMPSFVAPDPLRTAPEVPKTRVPTPPLPDVPKTEVPSPPLPETKAIPPPPAVSPPERTPASGATLRPFPAAPRIPPPPPNPPPKPEDLEVPGPPVWTPCSSPVSVAQQLFALPPMVDPAIFAGREEAIDARNAGSDGEVLRRRQELQGQCRIGRF